MTQLRQRPVRVVLVDDHPVVIEGLKALLDGVPDLEVVGSANDGSQATEVVSSTQPDVVLMDIRMADVGGICATRRLKEVHPSVAVIILTIYDAEIYVVEALRAGASGYLLKDSPQEVLISAIETVVDGGTHFPEDVDPSRVGEPRLDELTEREIQVLGMIAKGWTNRAIAEELHLAEVTIKKEVQTITRKLGVSDRTRAAVIGIQLGLIEP